MKHIKILKLKMPVLPQSDPPIDDGVNGKRARLIIPHGKSICGNIQVTQVHVRPFHNLLLVQHSVEVGGGDWQ
jgi:hypothetical protein